MKVAKDEKEEIQHEEIMREFSSLKSSSDLSKRSEESEVSSQRSEKSDTTKRSSSDKTATSSQNRLDQPLSLGKVAASPKGENDTPKAKQKIQQPSVDLGKPQIIFGEGMLEASISQQHSDVGTSRSSQSRLKTSLSLAKATMSLPTSQSSVVPQGRLRPQHSSLSRDSKSGNSASNFRTAQVMQRLGRNKGSSRQKTQISRPQIRPSEGPVNKGLGLLYMIDSPLPERMSPVAAVYGIPEGDLVISRVLAPKPPTTKVSSAVVAGAIRHTLTRNSQKSVGSSSTKTLQIAPKKRTTQEGIERT